jgi:hypothetical protein
MRLKANESLGGTSVERLLESLESVRLHKLTLDGERVRGVSMDAEQRELVKSLKVTPPNRDNIA